MNPTALLIFTSEIGPTGELVPGSMEAGECNTHHVTLGDSNSKTLILSIDSRTGEMALESVK